MRLIDADAFRKEVQEYVLPITTNNLMGAADAYHRIMHLLDDASTIEAEPVKHGRWIFKDDDRMPWCTQAICSHCKKVVANNVHLAVDIGQRDFVEENLYCPNCGAKMDGGAGSDA